MVNCLRDDNACILIVRENTTTQRTTSKLSLAGGAEE
jgi:hypothetical protein